MLEPGLYKLEYGTFVRTLWVRVLDPLTKVEARKQLSKLTGMRYVSLKDLKRIDAQALKK